MILKYKAVSAALLARMREVEEACRAEDGHLGQASLDPALNCIGGMNNTFLAFEGERLAAFLFLFVPMPLEAEVTAFTRPEYRGKGYFSALLAKASEEAMKHGIHELLFTAQSGTPTAPAVMKKLGAAYEYTEYRMHYCGAPEQEKTPRIRLIRAEIDLLEPLVSLACAVFGDSVEGARNLVGKALLSKKRVQYAAFLGEELIGLGNASLGANETFIFGLGIAPAYQGKGFGGELLSLILKDLLSAGRGNICLEVESKNERALRLYTGAGFEKGFATEYYRMKI